MSGRFAVVPSAWLDDPRIGVAEIAVLTVLASYADKQGWCYPNQQTMADQIKKSRPWVTDVIGQLAADGFIEVKNVSKTGKKNAYRLVMDRFLADAPSDIEHQPADIHGQPADIHGQPADIHGQPADISNNTIGTVPKEQEERVSAKPTFPSPTDLQDAFETYNDMAEQAGLPKALALNEVRRRHLANRLRELGSLSEWNRVLDKVYGSAFCRGDNDRGWRANLDFLLQPSSFNKLREGTYDTTRSKEQRNYGKVHAGR